MINNHAQQNFLSWEKVHFPIEAITLGSDKNDDSNDDDDNNRNSPIQGAANAKRNSPQTSSASSEGNDDVAMAVIMSLLEVRYWPNSWLWPLII